MGVRGRGRSPEARETVRGRRERSGAARGRVPAPGLLEPGLVRDAVSVLRLERRATRFSFPRRAFSTAELSSSELFTAMASEIAKQNRAARFNPQEIVLDSVFRYKIAFIHTHAGQHCVGLREERRGL